MVTFRSSTNLAPVEDEFRALEESLWQAETRFDEQYMRRVLSADFREFGRSGRRYDRDSILEVGKPGNQIHARLPLVDFQVSLVAPQVVLVTYVSEVMYDKVERANRSSIWVREAGSWRLRFHQGTPV